MSDALPAARRKRTVFRPSLRRRLLLFLLAPVLIVLMLDAILTYAVALAYSNHVHDGDLADDAITLAQMLKSRSSDGKLSPQARFLLEYDPDGREYFAVRSMHHGLISGSRRLPPGNAGAHPGQPPAIYDTHVGHVRLRAATVVSHNPREPSDSLRITIAENLHTRHQQARQILMLAIPLQILLIAAVLLLVRLGVNFGLRVIDPLTRRLGKREHNLAPIDDADVPIELLPLTRTIDALFARLRELMELHQRFVADAAHQLRTPLTGLSLHVERALAHPDSEDLGDALTHIGTLTARITRTCNQLLALTRAQSPAVDTARMTAVDLAHLVAETIESRMHDAWRAGVDLGYAGPAGAVIITGDAAALQELVDNLVDNALRYAGRDGKATVELQVKAADGVRLSIEDDGPGVDHAVLARLGERFYRAPGTIGDGTGLGLAIVQHIADRHGASVSYGHCDAGGLRVEIRFPAGERKP